MRRLILFFTLLTGCILNGIANESLKDSTCSDSVFISQMVDADEVDAEEEQMKFLSNNQYQVSFPDEIIPIVAISVGCGVPLFIVIAFLWFRYKNKQAKYRLAAQAIASGQEIPKDLFKDGYSSNSQNNEVLSKGIKNTCLGIGLGVFLWMLTEEEGIAAIGFLIFCMGIGQVVIAYATRPKGTDTHSYTDIEKR